MANEMEDGRLDEVDLRLSGRARDCQGDATGISDDETMAKGKVDGVLDVGASANAIVTECILVRVDGLDSLQLDLAWNSYHDSCYGHVSVHNDRLVRIDGTRGVPRILLICRGCLLFDSGDHNRNPVTWI